LLRRFAPRNDDGVPVSRLTLTDFRSYASATVEAGPGFVLLFVALALAGVAMKRPAPVAAEAAGH
jgi:hypothetical protein